MAAKVAYRVTDDGTHEIGVDDGDRFVTFASLSAARYAQLAENEDNRQAASGSGAADKDNGKEG